MSRGWTASRTWLRTRRRHGEHCARRARWHGSAQRAARRARRRAVTVRGARRARRRIATAATAPPTARKRAWKRWSGVRAGRWAWCGLASSSSPWPGASEASYGTPRYCARAWSRHGHGMVTAWPYCPRSQPATAPEARACAQGGSLGRRGAGQGAASEPPPRRCCSRGLAGTLAPSCLPRAAPPIAAPSPQALRVDRRARGTLPAARRLGARAAASCARARRRHRDRRVSVLALP